MKQTRRPRSELSKRGAARKKDAARDPAAPRTRMEPHPVFGKVRQIEHQYVLDGQTRSTWLYDLDYRPRMPGGAVRGDLSKQEFCNLCHAPHFWYVDQDKRCVECGKGFVFSAEEQKYWFEELKFNFHSKAIRCLDCRRERRRAATTMTALGEATLAVKRDPADPDALLAYARAASVHFQATKAGRLDKAIAACRKARRSRPELHEAEYWEAVCQEQAGRPARARDGYESFVASAGPTQREREFVALARERIAALTDGGQPAVGQ